LDPNQLVEIRDLIKNIGKNKTVFLSTHIMQEVEAICDRVIIIDHGKVVTDKALDKLVEEQQEQIIEVEFDRIIDNAVFNKLPHLNLATNTHHYNWELTFVTEEDMRSHVFDLAKNQEFKILQLSLRNKNLEQIFREKTTKQ
jgi:ABC-2 type transport system ATP-binding protein